MIDRNKFCILPFASLTINPTGFATPCCKFNKINTGDEEKSIQDSSLSDLFNQAGINKIRNKFLSGEKPEECRLCWTEERSGIKSLRQSINQQYTDEQITSLIEEPTIQIYDLKFTNLCNIKCRMCDSHFSSSWIPETIDLKMIPLSVIETHKKHSKQKFIKNSEHLKDFLINFKKIKMISFSGGEPLLQPEHDFLMSEIENLNEKANIRLNYNTNGTIYNEQAIRAWKYVSEVNVRISLDGTEDQFEFLRHGAKWNEVTNNIQRYKAATVENVKFISYITVNVYNILYLDRIIDYSINNGLSIKFNFLQFPNFMSIQLLSGTHLADPVKKYVNELYHKYKDNPLCLELYELVSAVEKIGEGPIQYQLITELFNISNRHDQYRNENFIEVFPILSELQQYILNKS
jgi:MoaA/NifB/PqqE/SkfB family radical SAM enzyme